MQTITLIAAVGENGCIGIGNAMPWHLPEDFAFFKQYTLGKPVLMGRKTWESLPRRPLPGRRNIVVSRQNGYQADGAEVLPSLEAALAACAEIYRQALDSATDLRLTEVRLAPAGDAFFPSFERSLWHEESRSSQQSADGTAFDFVHYRRNGI